MMTSITQTLEKKDLVMKLVILRESTMFQHVICHADGNYGGTIMEVKYDGEAHHPYVVHHGHA